MTQPGWYDDPERPDAQRYWDGQQWTSRRRRTAGATRPQPAVPPTQQLQPTKSTKAASGRLRPMLILGAVVLATVTAALVTGRVLLGTFLPGLLVLAAIVLAGVILAIRSPRRSRGGKAAFIAAVAVITALTVPLSMQVVYPTYHYFFPSAGTQAAGTQAGGSSAGPSGAGQSPGQSSAAPHIPAGILMVNTSDWTFGVVDPDSGSYTEVTKFKVSDPVLVPNVAASPDLTKFAVLGSEGAGWIDTNGTFTSVTPDATPTGPTNFSIGFDRAGNFFYGQEVGHTGQVNDEILDIYRTPAGSTSRAQKVQSAVTLQDVKAGWLDYDGTIHFGCKPRQVDTSLPVSWMGPDAITVLYGNGVEKAPVRGRDEKGCLTLGQQTKLTPEDTFGDFEDAVAKHDGSKIAFLAYMSAPSMHSLGDQTPSQPVGATSIFITDGNGQPTRLNTPNLSNYSQFVRWD